MELEGAAGFAREGVGIAQIPQISAFATVVTNLARESQMLFIKLDGALCLPQNSGLGCPTPCLAPFAPATARQR